MAVATMLWRRLDTPGHDACRLEQSDAGWRLQGTAVFRHDVLPARLDYLVECDPAWCTLRGQVSGWLGAQSIELAIARTAGGGWTLNGTLLPGLVGCVDLDLSFTPATNLLPVRRLGLAAGQGAAAPAAWLNLSAGTLEALPQHYERRDAATYWYEAPSVGYAGLLEVTSAGFVRRYPGLWETEA